MRIPRILLVSIVAGFSVLAAYAVVSTQEIRSKAELFLNAEASRDCPTLQELTVPTDADPCRNLQQRAFELSMLERTSLWHVNRDGTDRATASTTLGGNIPLTYTFECVNHTWYVKSA